MSYFESRYYYEIHGAGPPLLMLHGFTGSVENWHPFLEALTPHFSLILIDLLGHGRSHSPPTPTPYRMENTARDLASWLQGLDLGQKAYLLGYSMGGRLALYFALHYPHMLSQLILESASPGLKSGHAERIASDTALAERIEREGVEAFSDYWANIPLFQSQSESLKAELKAQRRRNSAQGLANSLRGMGTGMQPPLWEKLANLAMPTSLIVGEHDTKFVGINAQMAKIIPNARLHLVPQAGHIVHAESPAHFTQILLNLRP